MAAPHLQRLCDETGHTVNLAILDDVDIVYVERFRASRRHQNQIDLDLHVGSRLPAYCTSLGKVLLAFLPDSERDDVLDRTTFTRRGPNTRTSKTALLADLRRIRETGIAVNNEELAYGLRSVAVPVFSAGGEVVAALNLAAHRTMVSLDDLIARLGPIMQRTAAGISAQLGYRPRQGHPAPRAETAGRPPGSVARRARGSSSREGPGSTAGFRRSRATTRLPSAATAWTTPRLKPRKMAITKTP